MATQDGDPKTATKADNPIGEIKTAIEREAEPPSKPAAEKTASDKPIGEVEAAIERSR